MNPNDGCSLAKPTFCVIVSRVAKARTPTTLAGARRRGLPGVFRPRDLAGLRITRNSIRTWVRRGEVEVLGRGLFRQRDAEFTELETLAWVAKRAPGAVFCLLTALRVHEIGTQSPPDVWIAIDRKARKPKIEAIRIRVVRFAKTLLEDGVETREVLGVPVRITTPARTVVDCFRYRNKFGLDVALEALQDALRSRRATVTEIWSAAQAGRVANVMRPYIEALTA